MQLFCAAACFLFTSFTPLQASKLACGSNSDACYAAFLRSLTETFRGLNSCICALTSFSEGRHLAPLLFRSVIVLVGLGAFVCRVNERGLLGGLSGFRRSEERRVGKECRVGGGGG